MSISADDVRDLHRFEIKILLALERLMKDYRWVPEDVLRRQTKLSESELAYRLGHLMQRNMVKSSAVPYKGYQMVFTGFDALALQGAVRKGSVTSLGSLIGVGKEATVYEAMGMGVVALKFHRIGQQSFQTVRRSRTYMPQYKHFPWIFASSFSAQQEYEALMALHADVSVPVPVDINRNLVVMTFIHGVPIVQATLENPDDVFADVVQNVAKAYHLGYIHGDLSEFNIMVDGKGVWLIDWPQWTDPSHPTAEDILLRDITNICTHFSRKYRVDAPVEETLAQVVG
ncbi:MAG: serine/threonine protein phosphatase [Methanomicrobiales archaeon]|nr:serine/threonine protein phosphatase [Methanomicrobiales archaeon]